MAQTIALIDYGSGNVRSARNALARAAEDAGREAPTVELTADPDVIARADRIVLPGVGAFGDCAAALRARDGVIPAMTEAVQAKGRPFLGICVGLQLLADEGVEHGRHPGLGWIPGRAEALRLDDPQLKLPHMGWNQLTAVDHPVIAAAGPSPWMYFVHAYALTPEAPEMAAAACDYGGPFVAAAARDTVLGVQFHPEKSQGFGLALLAAFLEWRP